MIGEEPALVADGRKTPPDRREISIRWLSGTFLTGVISTLLMGVALSVALDGRQQLATPPEIAHIKVASTQGSGEQGKVGRIAPTRPIARAQDRRRMQVSTVTREGDREVVRTIPFAYVQMDLAAGHKTSRTYPDFDPLTVFANENANKAVAPTQLATGMIYGAKVESDMSIKTVDFPLEEANYDQQSELSSSEVEQVVRNTASLLNDGDIQLASLHYVDPQRFGETNLTLQALDAAFAVRVVPENMSIAARDDEAPPSPIYAEDIIPFKEERKITDAFTQAGYDGESMEGMAEAIAKLMNAPALKAGNVLRVGLEIRDEKARIVRTSIYQGTSHVLTIALNDRDQYVPANEPEVSDEIRMAFESSEPSAVSRPDLPSVYDGIYNTAYSYGMSREVTQQLVRLIAADVDLQARLTTQDRIEVFFSQPDNDGGMTEDSELLYVATDFSGKERRYYRYQTATGAIDYFDPEGRSARPFLLRNPVPNGRFTSGYGMRRHPILGYSRMHTGVDWAAPRGTPIIAPGDGVVEKAGWAGGYGRQTIIRHPNGYKTSFNHQSGIASGITAGAQVRQGQVIGYVGSTGQSTGNHLHYEVMVNDRRVDPMRVRLPVSRTLTDDDLEAFKNERERIDQLLKDSNDDPLFMASTNRVQG
ncbi:peptidase M24 [Limoniibacter endophyticus]|uniref:Peptidase M24 n=2 Tax=Limoniibacter endophyticus TaxID=1565040 RepID=A0A8J3DK95_9HYPH|nr:peptidase M24 [Limoniibacter endophyticus]